MAREFGASQRAAAVANRASLIGSSSRDPYGGPIHGGGDRSCTKRTQRGPRRRHAPGESSDVTAANATAGTRGHGSTAGRDAADRATGDNATRDSATRDGAAGDRTPCDTAHDGK
ncbi:MAG: hypothetical protein JWL83_2826 [Actinomycetia bacterium]|nr:hypothetical protein [Actinomycetes bacterium]